MKKVALIITNGSEPIETIVPLDLLIRAGNKVDLIALNNSDYVTMQGNTPIIKPDLHFQNVKDWDNYDALVLPGGNGHLDFLNSAALNQITKKMYDSNKVIAAICASGFVLAEYGLLFERHATAYPGFDTTKNVKWTKEKIVTDGNVITSQGPGTAYLFGLALIEKLNGKDVAAKIKKGTLI